MCMAILKIYDEAAAPNPSIQSAVPNPVVTPLSGAPTEKPPS
jgi:hypothetical protein